MKETIEFRIPEEDARMYLPADTGTMLGDSVRKVRVIRGDPLFDLIGEVDNYFRMRGSSFYTSWQSYRSYSSHELEVAEVFHVWPKRVFEPAGEECGTIYDESGACNYVFSPEKVVNIAGHSIRLSAATCGVGARQVTPLFLDGRRIPRRLDFARTIAGEWVVSEQVVSVFHENGLIGANLEPVRLSNKAGKLSEDYYQLDATGQPVELDPQTRVGGGPFDKDNYGRCPYGILVGLSVLSEVAVRGSSLGNTDVMFTRQMVGVRQGLSRPRPLLLLSPRAWRAVEAAKLKGLVFEVAHLV